MKNIVMYILSVGVSFYLGSKLMPKIKYKTVYKTKLEPKDCSNSPDFIRLRADNKACNVKYNSLLDEHDREVNNLNAQIEICEESINNPEQVYREVIDNPEQEYSDYGNRESDEYGNSYNR